MRNFVKISFRSMYRNPLYSLINLTGLVIGMLCVLLTYLWVNYEMGYDKFNKNNDRIFKISQGDRFSTVPPIFNHIRDKFPEIEKIIRTSNDAEAYISSIDGDNKAKVQNVLYSNADFDDIFSCNTISGNVNSALNDPGGIVLTKKTAFKIFGNTNAEGRVIHYMSTFPIKEMTLTVKSVVEDFPSNSSLKFDAIIPFKALDNINPNGMKPDENWRDGYCNMYVLLKKGTNSNEFASKLEAFGGQMEQIVYGIEPQSTRAKERKLGLVNLTELHFHNNNKKQLITYISMIGLLIMLIAVINYINLTIAKLYSTYPTLLIRKINGANRFSLVFNIIAESVLYSIFACVFALFFIKSFQPLFSSLLSFDIAFNFKEHPANILFLLITAIIIGIAAGLYPAIKLTSNIPVAIAKARFIKKDKQFIRQSLVVIQFAISIVLIISVFIISKQLNFLTKKELGFDTQKIIYTQLNKNLYGPYGSFKEKLLQNPNIKSISGSQNELGQICVTLTRDINGTDRYFQELPADPDFIETMGLQLIKGRNFSYEMQSDPYQTLIINETAVKAFELDSNNIIGTEVLMYDRKARIIGVVKDFYFQSFHHKLDPFMLYYHPGSIGTANIKLIGNDIPGTIEYISMVWNEFSPNIPFEYHFLDNTYEKLYEQDRQFSKIILSFLLIAIIIASLGLFGLVSFTSIQRTKEIGIRKVNGAKVSEVMTMLNKDYVKWVALAFVIATPVAYFIMNKWLENFAYKTNLDWWVFALAGAVAMGIALLTVSSQSWRAATRNPVEALRYE